MALVFAAIAPHGGLAIAEACTAEDREVAAATRAGMEELGRLYAAARPQAVVVATPHNIHIPGAIGVLVAGRVAGRLAGAPPAIALDVPTELTLAWRVLESLASADVSASGVSFGSNDPADAVAPMDWGVLIPLWFMGGREQPPTPLVVVTPARDLSAADHIHAGVAIAAAAAASGLRVAFIASADHGHAHDAKGPYGFDPAAKEYDRLICELVRGERLDRLADIQLDLVEAAKADSWWQMLMLHGATIKGWNGRLVSYEAPTYFGMLTAAYEPALPARHPRPSPPPSREKEMPAVSRGSASPPRKHTARRTRAR
jgi:aromatic ring-opening dioxygenase LigB subunit